MPASLTRAQNGSNIGWLTGRGPDAVVGAAGRITMQRAPRSSAQSSSSQAQFTSAKVMYGAAYMRFW